MAGREFREKMRSEKMEELKEAAIQNNVETLARLLQEDPLILDKLELNSQDMNPLHIAAIFGSVEFVKRVLRVSPDLSFAGDRFRRIPLHLAIMKGKLNVVQELVNSRPIAAREKIDGGGNALHLCVKYNQLGVLKFLVETVKSNDFVSRKDDDGMTILHLAVSDKQTETIKFLVENSIVQVNVKNSNGSTPLDLVQGDSSPEIARILQRAGARRGRDLDASVTAGNTPQESSGNKPAKKGDQEWLSRKRDAIMVVASLIATMAFQAGVNPTGGVWQQDDDKNGIVAGTAVMALKHPTYYKNFIRTNTVAFVSSLSTILFLISGLPFRHKFFMWALMVIMWLTVTAIALTYGISIMMVTPAQQKSNLSQVIRTSVTVWCGVMSLMLLGNTIRLINRWLRRQHGIDLFGKFRRQGSSAAQEQRSGNQKGLQYV